MARAEHGRVDFRKAFDECHSRVAAGDKDAADRMCVLLRAELVRQLRLQFPRERADVIDTAVNDTLMKYLRRPELYLPNLGDPVAWLVAVGRNYVRNELRSRGRRVRMLYRLADCRQQLFFEGGGDDPDGVELWLDRCRQRLLDVAKSEQELRFIEAKMAGASDVTLAGIIQGDSAATGDDSKKVRRHWKTILRRLNRRRERGASGKG